MSGDGLQDNSQHRKMSGAKPLHFDSCVQRGMQEGFTDDLQRLRPRRYQFCGEQWFAAQTPTQAAAVAGGQYTYDRCKRDKKTVNKSFSSANDVDPESVPSQLKALTQAEEMLIAKDIPNSAVDLPFSFGYEKKCALELSVGNTTHLHGGVA